MVIRKGVDWGWDDEVPADLTVCASDAQAAEVVGAAVAAGRQAAITLRRGDLWRTVGGAVDEPASGSSRCLPIDLGYVQLDDGPERPFVAHVVARRFGWQGTSCVVMNAAWVGDLYLGPRAHPNDDLLDITVGSVPLRQRFEAGSGFDPACTCRIPVSSPHGRIARSSSSIEQRRS
ncbi:MAG: hypothetical protein R2706_08985 [Acidimicrobiales bacterium]